MRRKPYSVVLLDEIEKAHPDVFNILLQVLDEGHLTDNYGRVIDFKNTVVIMTSNVGARDIMQGKSPRLPRRRHEDAASRRCRRRIKDEMHKVFNPEFLNRLDDVIVFHPLDREHIAQIVTILLRKCSAAWATRSSSRRPRSTSWSSKGYDENYGARPLQAGHPAVRRGSAQREDPDWASSAGATRSRWTSRPTATG